MSAASDAVADRPRKRATRSSRPRTALRAVQVGAEIFPFVKTGGLGDVMAALPPALVDLGVDVRLVLPGYAPLLDALGGKRRIASLGPAFGAASIDVLRGTLPNGCTAYLVDAPLLFGRGGNPYVAPDGRDWPDNPRRFALLGWAAAHLALGDLDRSWGADVLHGHDWHAGLAFAHLARHPVARPAGLFTVHNLAFVGPFMESHLPELMLPAEIYSVDGVEFFGAGSFMKAGLFFADWLSTVSPTYAAEIQTPQFGCRFEGLLRSRQHELSGIVNGIDADVWNPAADPQIAAAYDSERLDGKARCKLELQRAFGLPQRADEALIGVVSRLSHQKGIDLLIEACTDLVASGAQLAVLGSGDASLEQRLRALAQAHPESIAVTIGYDEALAHRIIAGADMIAVPSRYEPCGLTQLYGLRYGTLPLVRRIGGLADTVVDASDAAAVTLDATGFAFDDASVPALVEALGRALRVYADRPRWQQMMRRAMASNFSWQTSAQHYRDLYAQLAARRQENR